MSSSYATATQRKTMKRCLSHCVTASEGNSQTTKLGDRAALCLEGSQSEQKKKQQLQPQSSNRHCRHQHRLLLGSVVVVERGLSQTLQVALLDSCMLPLGTFRRCAVPRSLLLPMPRGSQ